MIYYDSIRAGGRRDDDIGNAEHEIKAAEFHSRCGWTPFEGWKVKGKAHKVVLRGKTAFEDGKIYVKAGYEKNIRG